MHIPAAEPKSQWRLVNTDCFECTNQCETQIVILTYYLFWSFTDSAKQPKKPPRPSLPCTPKPIPRKTQTGSPTSTPSSQPIVDLALTTRPVPQPRSKTKPLSPSNQVNVQPLIPLQDSREDCPVKPVETSDAHSGKYLQELLDVFSSEPLSNSVNIQEEQTIQTKENQGDNMTSLHSDRNIRSRIQAFESQTNTEDDETSVPFPRPRKVHAKPPVLAPKPSIAPRPSVKMPKEEQLSQFEGHLYEMVNTPPMPAPRPQLFKKPSLDSKDDSDSQPPPFRASLIPPSRPSLVKLKNVSSQDEEGLLKGPPTPLKPSKDLLNLNNHNSTALVSNIASTVNMLSDDYVDATSKCKCFLVSQYKSKTRYYMCIHILLFINGFNVFHSQITLPLNLPVKVDSPTWG